MRRLSIFGTIAAGAASCVICLISIISCEGLYEKAGIGEGTIVINFDKDVSYETKSGPALPDSNKFILRVSDSEGDILYCGQYGAAPKSLTAKAGTYCIEAYSRDFSEPLFDTPQYGDIQTVKVVDGKETKVLMNCIQMNSGIKLKAEKSFISTYPEGTLYVCSSAGRLMYGYTETRIGYFKPGTVKITLSNNGREETLASRTVESQQVLTLRLTAGTITGKSGIGIQIDTARNWTDEDINIGNVVEGSTIQTAFSVSKAKQHIGETVWIYGYIVGGDLSSSKCSFDAPFTSRTNIVIAEKSSCRDKQDCLSVQLSQGDIRDALNLVDNPSRLGQQVFLKGKIVSSYYGIPGIQSISEYQWK